MVAQIDGHLCEPIGRWLQEPSLRVSWGYNSVHDFAGEVPLPCCGSSVLLQVGISTLKTLPWQGQTYPSL